MKLVAKYFTRKKKQIPKCVLRILLKKKETNLFGKKKLESQTYTSNKNIIDLINQFQVPFGNAVQTVFPKNIIFFAKN